jgi:hypothetical protein
MHQILGRGRQWGKAWDRLAGMGFCEHCEGQRFDRAQVLRLLRDTRKHLSKRVHADEALAMAIKAVRAMDIPHLERFDEVGEDEIIH